MSDRPSQPGSGTPWLEALTEPAAIVHRDGALVALNRAWGELRPGDRPGASLMHLAQAAGVDAEALSRLRAQVAGSASPGDRSTVIESPGTEQPWEALDLAALGEGRTLVRAAGGSGRQALRAERDALLRSSTRLRGDLRRMQAAQDHAGLGFWRLNVNTGELWWSDEVYRIHGRAVGDTPNLEAAIEHYTPESRPVIAELVERGIRDSAPWDVDLQLDRADGRRIWVRAMGRVEREEDETLIYGAFSDITRQKQQALDARAKDEQLQFVLNGSNDGHWDWNLETDEVWYSPRYLELLGYGADEFESSLDSFAASLHPDDRERVFADVTRHLDERVPYENEHRLRCKDGAYRWFRARGQATRTEDGRPVRLSGASTDITTQVLAVRELEDTRRAAIDASRAKSEFLANMSHEIRTPMTAILGFTDLLLDEHTSEEAQRDYAGTIRRNGEHLLALINDILDLSKIEAGRLTVERIPVSIEQEVEAVVGLMRPRAAANGLELSVEFPPILPRTIPSDPLRVRQVLTNLLGNAIKFTARGSVAVRVHFDPDRPLVSLEVEDTGIGVPPEAQSALFQAFSQADSSTTRRFGGTGLGLTISQRLMEALDGTLECESTEGEGSRFTARMPIPTDAILDLQPPGRTSAAGAVEPVAGAELLEGRTVLLVEDGADNRKLISLYLRRAGASIEFAEDGQSAVDALREARLRGSLPDVVLMDMQMPRLDGYAAARVLRGEGFDLPIVAITAHAMSGDEARCLEAGCDGYLSKPVEVDRMLELLGRMTDAGRRRAG